MGSLRMRVLQQIKEWEAAQPRPNRHWTDEEQASRLLWFLEGEARAEAWWRQVWGGIGLALLGGVLLVLVLSW